MIPVSYWQNGTCSCGKVRYRRRRDAKHAAKQIATGKRLRTYRCYGGGPWHLTSASAARTAFLRERAARQATA